MSHKVNAKAIGAFTILAVVLLVAGVLTFGSGDLFRTEYDVEMVFTGSVKGLNKGSAITFRGVRIGEVKEVNLDFEGDGKDIIIRVVGALVQEENGQFTSRKALYAFLDEQIKKGLRAQLVAQSFVTGQLQIQLEYFPGQLGYLKPNDNDSLDIPTVPTDFEIIGETVKTLARRVDQLPLVEIAERFMVATDSINRLANSEALASSFVHLDQSLVELKALLKTVNEEKHRFFSEYYQTNQAVRTMASNVSRVAGKGEDIIERGKVAIKEMRGAIAQTHKTLKIMEQSVEPGSELRTQVLRTLESVERSAEQFRQLGETLERNPEAVLQGKHR